MSGDRWEGVGRDEATFETPNDQIFFFSFFFLSLNPHKKPSPSFFIYPTKIIPFKTLGNSKKKILFKWRTDSKGAPILLLLKLNRFLHISDNFG